MDELIIKDLKIHTLEITCNIAEKMYYNIREFLYSQNERIFQKGNIIKYTGLTSNGIQILLCKFCDSTVYQIRYIINLSRFNNGGNYLGLMSADEAANILENVEIFLRENYSTLPSPFSGKVTRIDLTKDICVGDDVRYIIKLLNRIFIPRGFTQYMLPRGGYPKDNATFTKINKRGKKLFELSFYDKHSEMLSHMENASYSYSEETLNQAKGILRMEMRLFAPRLKNMKKTNDFHTVREFLTIFPEIIDKVAYKNIRALFLSGDFYKEKHIRRLIENSNYQAAAKK